jgi:pimeloyl-ACP methyl ester carboxylesterase
MNETCSQTMASVKPKPPAKGAESSRASLADVLQRLDREAIHGVCNTGRYQCRYYTWGQGPPLLIVPGLGTDARSFALLCDHLHNDFRCIAYDLPVGQGEGVALGQYDLAALVADVFVLLDHLKLEQSYVLGFSFGSTIALAALRDRPDRLSCGVLVGGFAQRTLAPAERLLARLARHWQAPLGRVPFYETLLRRAHHGPFADHPAELWRFFIDCAGALATAAFARRALLLEAIDLRADLPDIRQPVLLVRGEDDPLVSPQDQATLVQGLAKAEHIELSGCGHYAPLTHAAGLAEVVRRFLLPPCQQAPDAHSCPSMALP